MAYQIGIATSTEVGLEDARWPIRVRVAPAAEFINNVDTVCHYWPITNAAVESIPFQPKSQANEPGINALYKSLPGLDDYLWIAWNVMKGKAVTTPVPAEITTQQDIIKAGVQVANPIVEQTTQLNAAMKQYCNLCTRQFRIIMLPISNDHYLIAEPHGRKAAAHMTATAERQLALEALLSSVLNYTRMKARYPDIAEGTLNMCAFAASNIFALGYYEHFSGPEYYTVYVNPGANF